MSKKLTTEEFIAKAKEVHGDKYDYSKVEYVNANTKVSIICPEHGEFWQLPSSHLCGKGCKKCATKKSSLDRMRNVAEFIAKAREVHGDKYDYSKVEYKGTKNKVCIICPEHGEFWQAPSGHFRGRGCPKCSHPNVNLTTEEFIAKAREVHGDKYDYSKVGYKGTKNKVCIICPEHGEFWQTPSNHLNGSGCKKCAIPNSDMTTEEFIAKAKEVHGDKYDYSKTKYINWNNKVCIICPEHGEFWQTPSNHLNGAGCKRCIRPNQGMTTEEFIAKAKEVHGDKYDYSKTKYKNIKTNVCIICPEHGEFWQLPDHHLRGRGCKKCAYEITANKAKRNSEEFIAKAKEVHGDKYDYSKVEYVNSQTKVCIICPEHGEFWQTPANHIKGTGCPKCVGKYKTTEDFIKQAKKIHGDRYDYSKTEYINANTKVCIISPDYGEFWQLPNVHLSGCGFNRLKRTYRFNLLQEFEDEYEFRAFLANNDVNILQAILMSIEPKYEPIKKDIEKALRDSSSIDPIHALEEKYSTESDNEEEDLDTEEPIDITTIDLDDDDAIDAILKATEDVTEETEEPTLSIEEVVRNNEKELKVINRIEPMLTPEIREYIMDKFLNDKRRMWIAERERQV